MSFHEFNPFTGRLRQSRQVQPLYPISPLPLQSRNEPIMFYDSIKTKPVKTPTMSRANFSTLDPKLAVLYKKYQANLHKPVYTLGGRKDRFLYGLTILLSASSFVVNMYYLNTAASK